MAKKKSKTQKSKQNQRKKVKKTQTKVSKQENIKKRTTPKPKKNNDTTKKEQTSPTKSKRIVDKKEVKYNVLLDKISKENIPQKEKQLVSKDKVKYNVVLTEQKDNTKKTTQEKTPKIKKGKKSVTNEANNKNKILRAYYVLKINCHILFNAILIITYIILLTGLIRSNSFSKGAIIYISCIVIFLILVATAYTKYISGKVFSIFITAGMLLGIYNIQYTYDFINNLNSNEYEYKTYYVVTFNNGQNKSIYNINNKKICLLKDNSKNIKRKLDTKLDSAIYIEHEDPNKLYSEFYNTNCRAIIVNENQYKYLNNNIEPNSRNIKILYEFKANGKK